MHVLADRLDVVLIDGGRGQVEAVDAHEFEMQGVCVPCFGVGLRRDIGADEVLVHIRAHGDDGLVHVGRFHQLDALLVDDFALVVHHVVELEERFTDFVVALLDLGLGALNRLVHPGVDDGFAFLHA